MDGDNGLRDDIHNDSCACGEEDGETCYVLMTSATYGTEAWPCPGLDEAIRTLARLARSAEERRRTDGVQRYFCILGSVPKEGAVALCDPVSPDDTQAGGLTLHLPLAQLWQEEAVPCRCGERGMTAGRKAA